MAGAGIFPQDGNWFKIFSEKVSRGMTTEEIDKFVRKKHGLDDKKWKLEKTSCSPSMYSSMFKEYLILAVYREVRQ